MDARAAPGSERPEHRPGRHIPRPGTNNRRRSAQRHDAAISPKACRDNRADDVGTADHQAPRPSGEPPTPEIDRRAPHLSLDASRV